MFLKPLVLHLCLCAELTGEYFIYLLIIVLASDATRVFLQLQREAT